MDVGIIQYCDDPSSTGICDVHFKDSDHNQVGSVTVIMICDAVIVKFIIK